MLRMFCQIDRLLTEFECASGMTARVGPPANFFFHLGIFDHALQNPCPHHQDKILLLVGNFVGGGGFVFGALKISAVKMDICGIQICRAYAMMIGTMLVNGLRNFEMIESLAAQV